MVENYEVYMGKTAVGKVQVTREGLYYHFVCRCRLDGDNVRKLSVKCGDVVQKLGVLVPVGDGFGLEKRIPVKHIGVGVFSFLISPCHNGVSEMFIPLSPEEPFAYIERLEDAFLYIQGGKTGIVFRK